MARSIQRRAVLAGMAGVAAAAAPWRPVRAAEEAPLRIGLCTVKTGPLAQGGLQMEQGLTVFLKERNYQIAGRKVALTVADTGGNPAGARSRIQELIERDKVDFIVGPLAAFEAIAVNDTIRTARVPTLICAGAEDLTQRKPNPWAVRPSCTSAQPCHPLAHYGAVDRKFKRMLTIAEDFAYGHEQVAGFQRVFEDNGGRIVKKLWPPISIPDDTPYIAQMQKVDAIFVGMSGSNPTKFFRQYSSFGSKFPVLAGETAADEPNFKHAGDEMVGVISASFYSGEIDTPTNHRLIATMEKDYQAVPGFFAVTTYLNGQFIEAALAKTGGNATDRDAVMKALRAVSLTDTPRGPVHLDNLGNAVGNIYIREVRRKNGKLVNAILKTYENVGQFWTYDEKWFLAQPVYSRNYPPARYLEP